MRLIILDRDGVINQDSANFIKSAQEWQPIPGSLEAIARLNQADYRVVIATNQSGLARGLFHITQLHEIHRKMYQLLAGVGGSIDAIFFCPHGPDDDCYCRKPKPGLFLDIAQRLQLETLTAVPAVGDSIRDIRAAQAAGANPILVLTGKGQQTLNQNPELAAQIACHPNLAEAVDALLAKG